MKCPVCDQENSTMLCTRCGFDASTDCTMHPTLGPVGSVPSISARRKQWLDSQKKSVSSPAGPQFVDYQKKVSDAATADEQDHQSHESHLLRSLQTANEQIAALMRDKREYKKRIESLQTELKTLTHWVYPENQTLKGKIQTKKKKNQTLEGKIQTLEEKIQILSKANNALIKESIQMEDNVHDLVTQLSNADRRYQDAREYISSLEEKNKVLKSNLDQSEDYRIASSQRYGEEARKVMEKTKKITEKDKEIAELESKLLAAKQRAAELEAERSKGIIARIFNR